MRTLTLYSVRRGEGRGESVDLTVSVTGRWAGADSALEQEKPEAIKMLDAKRAAETHLSSARFVQRLYVNVDVIAIKYSDTPLVILWLLYLSRRFRPSPIVQIGYRIYVPKYPKNAI